MSAKDYSKYKKMCHSGSDPKEVCAAAITDGYNLIDIVPMMRAVFNFDFVQSKEAWIQAQGIASSLDEYQQSLLPDIKEALDELEKYEQDE